MVLVVFCVWGGVGYDLCCLFDGLVIGIWLIYVVCDMLWGMVLCSYFFMGEDLVVMGMLVVEIEYIFLEVNVFGLF